MLSKDKVLEAIKSMPEEFSVEDVLERVMFLQKIEEGLVQSKSGQVHEDGELDNRLPSWLS